ncbi:MAG: DUF2490 domain-containing protein [Spirosomataceae bacterium]
MNVWRTKYYLLVLGLFFCSPTALVAQHYTHFTVWSRAQVVIPFSTHWNLATTFHWRRQNNYHLHADNPLGSPLATAGQLLLTHRNTANTFWIHAGQLSYYYSNQLLGKELDFNALPRKEIRYAGGIELNEEITEKLTLRQRLMQEFRFFEDNHFHPVGRIRTRANARYQLKPFVSINGVAEILFHNPPVLAHQKLFRFNQYWLGSSLLWRLNERVNLETGYTFIMTRRVTIVEFDDQNIINLHLTVQL